MDTDRLDPMQPRPLPDDLLLDRTQQLMAALEHLIQTLPSGNGVARYAAKLDAQDRTAGLWLLLTLDEELEGAPNVQPE